MKSAICRTPKLAFVDQITKQPLNMKIPITGIAIYQHKGFKVF